MLVTPELKLAVEIILPEVANYTELSDAQGSDISNLCIRVDMCGGKRIEASASELRNVLLGAAEILVRTTSWRTAELAKSLIDWCANGLLRIKERNLAQREVA